MRSLLEVSNDSVGLIPECLSVPVHQVLDIRIVVTLERLGQNAGRFILSSGSLKQIVNVPLFCFLILTRHLL
jgi:hypothetical protein